MRWIEQQIDRLMRGQAAGFREVLAEALEEPSMLPEAIEALEEVQLDSAADARLTVALLRRLPLPTEDAWRGPHQTVMAWLEEAEEEALAVLIEEAVPELVRIHDALRARLVGETDVLAVATEALSVLQVLVLYQADEAVERLAADAVHPILQNAYVWSSIFEVLDASDHPWRGEVIAHLKQRWPGGYARLAYLEHANAMAHEGELAGHPFDDPRGHAALSEWLRPQESLPGAARTAASALSFVDPVARGPLLAQAEAHPETTVRIEAAGVRALGGDPVGIERLRAWAEDPRYAAMAITHLERAGADDAVPPISREPDFRAAAAMASWLAQPTEFSRPPDDLVTVDTRELHWPPTDDRRRVWLFRYRYWPLGPEEPSFEGLGMVGSVTFAMADEDTEDLSVPEAYGLHCAFELEMMDDGRAPPFRDASAGLRILRESNPDL